MSEREAIRATLGDWPRQEIGDGLAVVFVTLSDGRAFDVVVQQVEGMELILDYRPAEMGGPVLPAMEEI